MALLNIIIAVIAAVIARQLGADGLVTFLVGFATFRVETALTNQIAQCKMLQQLAVNDAARLQAQLGAHERAVAEIARNN